ncbi:small GTP-binding protein domain [Edhazardia aedis USNM 41457]|uniref:Small GTP-binding protein domain n=1 Tax=Edhazardia aedis (strain USNM 41457) TaxID=1003232 RepID=J9DTQ8_EDHAE|nr:small GTP-binding protein domain [Edhazardia aedis USNM 41457]|eukprot:EJW04677.1 small GTP-binding protein domain [Edhazardia aedis USNM 41457]
MNITSDMVYNYKLVVLGYYSVGKSSLVMKYVKREFNPNEESTIGAAFCAKTVQLKDCNVKYEIWDTAGQERYNSLIPMYYRGAQVALIVYDITNPQSFTCAKKWVDELKEEKPKDFLKVLVGNKSDLDASRKIHFEDGLNYAEQNGLLFYETSAKTGYNVDKIFEDVASILPRTIRKSAVPSINVTGKNNFGCC